MKEIYHPDSKTLKNPHQVNDIMWNVSTWINQLKTSLQHPLVKLKQTNAMNVETLLHICISDRWETVHYTSWNNTLFQLREKLLELTEWWCQIGYANLDHANCYHHLVVMIWTTMKPKSKRKEKDCEYEGKQIMFSIVL